MGILEPGTRQGRGSLFPVGSRLHPEERRNIREKFLSMVRVLFQGGNTPPGDKGPKLHPPQALEQTLGNRVSE